jgi:hypothetical protein
MGIVNVVMVNGFCITDILWIAVIQGYSAEAFSRRIGLAIHDHSICRVG